jgi:hypothetical protein
MRTVKFIASVLRPRNNGVGRLLPCRSAPV